MQPCTGVYNWKDGHRLSLRETGWRGSALVSVNAKRMNRARRFARTWPLVVEVECGRCWSLMSWWWCSPYKYSAPIWMIWTKPLSLFRWPRGNPHRSVNSITVYSYAEMQADADKITSASQLAFPIDAASATCYYTKYCTTSCLLRQFSFQCW